MYKIIDGKSISNVILDDLRNKINDLKIAGKQVILADVFVGDNPASIVYVNSKIKKFDEVGIKLNLIRFKNNITEDELISRINDLNNDKNINGIFIEMPLPPHINSNNVIDKISYKKDVDGFGTISLGALFSDKKGFYPCTAEGIVELLKKSKIRIAGKHCVVLGRSNIVGKPVAMLLLKENATVTICHSKTNNLEEICRTADILIAAVGKAKFIDEKYVKDGAVVIDAGINKIFENGKSIVCGDVDFEKVANYTSYITPVPGGVGPMTTTILIKHCVETLDYE